MLNAKYLKHYVELSFTAEAIENEGVDLDNEDNKNPDCRQVVFRLYRIAGYVLRDPEQPVYSKRGFQTDYTKVQPALKLTIDWQGTKTFEVYQQTFTDNDMLEQFLHDLNLVFKECEKWAYELTHEFRWSI